MERELLSYDEVTELPVSAREFLIGDEHLDANGHMNIRWYFDFYSDGLGAVLDAIGLGWEDGKRSGCGFFTVAQHLRYLSETLAGETLTARIALLDRSDRGLHGVVHLVNESRRTVAYTNEFLCLYVDLSTRRTTPFRPDQAAGADALLAAVDRMTRRPVPCGRIAVRGSVRTP